LPPGVVVSIASWRLRNPIPRSHDRTVALANALRTASAAEGWSHTP
jgi:hypothetical protein